MMSVENIGRILNITHSDFLSKAREIERLLTIKVPAGTLKKGEVCRSFIAVDLTCKLLQISLSKKSILSHVPVTSKVYSEAYTSCQQLLNLVFPNQISIDTLALKYGQENIVQKAKLILQSFLSMTPQRNKSSEILHSAAFFVTLKHHQGSIPRQKFVADNELNGAEFREICDEFETKIKTDQINFNGKTESINSLGQNPVNRATFPDSTNTPTKSCQQPTRILAGSSLKTLPVASRSSTISTPLIENETHHSDRYRSGQGKRAVETMNIKFPTALGENDEFIIKRQFTEKIYKMWKKEFDLRSSGTYK